jgi:hypothetical protein
VGLERGPLSLGSTSEELRGRKSSGSGLEAENMAVGIRHADNVAPSIRMLLRSEACYFARIALNVPLTLHGKLART